MRVFWHACRCKCDATCPHSGRCEVKEMPCLPTHPTLVGIIASVSPKHYLTTKAFTALLTTSDIISIWPAIASLSRWPPHPDQSASFNQTSSQLMLSASQQSTRVGVCRGLAAWIRIIKSLLITTSRSRRSVLRPVGLRQGVSDR
jgi:hypothetical protein